MSVNGLFRKRNENVAGTADLAYFFDGLGSVSKSTDCLRTADFVYFCSTGKMCGYQCNRGYLSIFSRRCCHHNTFHASYFSRDYIHQYTGWIGCFSARNIDTDTFECCNTLSQNNPVFSCLEPAVAKLLFVKITNVCQRFFHHFDQGIVYLIISFFDFLFGHFDRIFCDHCFIKFFGISKKCLITVFFYVI